MDEREDPKSVQFDCLRVLQPIELESGFFVGSMPYSVLCAIADFDVRRVIQEERDVERYLGIQRPLKDDRVKELEKYVNFKDATFPSSIILAVEEKCAVYDDVSKIMTLKNFPGEGDEEPILFRNIARVLDGQHRIAGLYEYKGETFDVPVTIFVGIDISDQAQIFSTVNLEQTKVTKSLAYDLYALARTRSPQRTCHDIAIALDRKEGGPLYKRIKRLGVATPGRLNETITQATFVEALLRYISNDPRTDRDTLLRGNTPLRADSEELEKRPFRNLFIDEEDLRIAEIVSNFFEAVRKRWPMAWDNMGRGNMLNKTNGFKGLMRVMLPAYRYFAAPGDLVSAAQFLQLFERTNLQDEYFTIENFPPGTSGESELNRTLLRELGLSQN